MAENIAAILAAEGDAAERAELRGEPVRTDSAVSRGHARTRVLQVRLNDEELAALEARAEQAGIPSRPWLGRSCSATRT